MDIFIGIVCLYFIDVRFSISDRFQEVCGMGSFKKRRVCLVLAFLAFVSVLILPQVKKAQAAEKRLVSLTAVYTGGTVLVNHSIDLEKLTVMGNDYNTHDGTGVRDYIHVVDLAIGHLKAIEKLEKEPKLGLKTYNLGTGNGYSVLEIIETFQRVNNIKIPYSIAERRAGDAAECYSVPDKAAKELGWKATHTLEEMCRDAWNYAKNA